MADTHALVVEDASVKIQGWITHAYAGDVFDAR
jgi:hypothetical protein